jgi:hypothetical protein
MFVDRSLHVPDFADLQGFVEWYVGAGMPLLPPENPEVFLSDDATATCLFRKGQYQVEMYLIHPNPLIPVHQHPGVENLEIGQSGWKTSVDFNLIQRAGQAHGMGFRVRAKHNGFALYSAQKWDAGITMSTIGARWKGYTAGVKHEALIRRFNPDCYIQNGYADVTRKAL